MTEIFGDPSDFAIEAGVEPELVAPAAAGLRVDISRVGFVRASHAFVAWFKIQERRLSSETPRL